VLKIDMGDIVGCACMSYNRFIYLLPFPLWCFPLVTSVDWWYWRFF